MGTHQRWGQFLWFERAADPGALSRVLRRLVTVPRDKGVNTEPIEGRALAFDPLGALFKNISVETQCGGARWARSCRPPPDRSVTPEEFRTTARPARRTVRLRLPLIIYRIGGDQESWHINDEGLAEVYRRTLAR